MDNKYCPFTNNKILDFRSYLIKQSKIRELSYDSLKAMVLEFSLPSVCSKDNFYKFYVTYRFALIDFKKLGLNQDDYEFLLSFYKITRRTSKEEFLLRNVNAKKTWIEKYGVENISQLDITKQKKAETFLKNYGVDNIWKSHDYHLWLNNYMLTHYGKRRLTDSKKMKVTNLKKYGKEIPMLGSRFDGFDSKLEKRISGILVDLNISFEYCYFLGGYYFDFFIKDKNIVLEVNGDFWHANPKIFNAEDELKPINKTASEIWAKDKLKRCD